MPIDSEVVGAGLPAEPMADVAADTTQSPEGAQESAPRQDDYKFVLATGQRYRTEDDLVRAQENASVTIDTLKAQALLLQQQLQMAQQAAQVAQPQQQAQPELDPEFLAQYQTVYQGLIDGGAAPEFADKYARVEAARSLSMVRQLQGQISNTVGSLQKAIFEREYEQIVEKDPSFDFSRTQSDPQAAFVWKVILEARPNGSPSEHYQMFSRLTNKSLSPETKALIQQQADARRDALRMPAGGGSGPQGGIPLDSPEVEASVKQWLVFQRSAGRSPSEDEVAKQRGFIAQRIAARPQEN